MTKKPAVPKVPATGAVVADSERKPPFETDDLRKALEAFLNMKVTDIISGVSKVGDYRWGVYAFYDYDNEPIYVGQTNEKLRTRIRRHLTNQRTDAVAMSVLDPFEVFTIRVWPLPEYQRVTGKSAQAERDEAVRHLNALEKLITDAVVGESEFRAVLNEKDAPNVFIKGFEPPTSYEGQIVSERVSALRSHPDSRLARRALIISRLSQTIAERQVKGGLRRALLTQAKRMQWLAERRYNELGGALSVESKRDEGEEDENDE